ncbi:MAG TPA: hypothetical protein VFE62_27050 [Gemmataceae bacterium]|nr:hypothetical protein [Gemmataceae bacterium]
MNHAVSLTLELLEQTAAEYSFRMTVRNESTVKLFLPFSDITGLKFRNTATGQMAEWSTHLFVSAAGGGFTLQANESRSVDWRVRPCSVEPPPETPGDFSDWDYRRWCIGLEPGSYQVWFEWRVDEDYFDPDSHMRFPELECAAEREEAIVWRGVELSNRVPVVHPAPSSDGGDA